TPLGVATWGPLVFVPAPPLDGALPLPDFLAPLPERSAGPNLDAMRFAERRTYELACNWKVFVDNYLDGGYHVNTIHPGLAGALDYSQYRTEISGNTAVQTSPLRTPEGGTTETGKVRTGAAAYYWWVFPNLMLNMYEGIMD